MILAILAVSAPAIVPQPVTMRLGSGAFLLTPTSTISVRSDTEQLGETLREYLAPATGYRLPLTGRSGSGSIRLHIDRRIKGLGPEGYRLEVKPDFVEVAAPTEAGVFYGIQTLRQLFPASIYRKAPVANEVWAAPCVSIEDQPRFSWRGAHLDVGRHFMPKEFVLKFIDLLAMHKLNVLHWHLTDDQGWRIEIKKYPKLTQIGSYRKDTMLTYSPPTYEGKPHSGFYTQDDVREVVAYAAKRFVTVVPEIEMPGHSSAAISAYPQLGNTGRQRDVPTSWGVINDVFNAEDSTILFLQDVLTEVMALFPSRYIHVGGDEVPKTQWHASPAAQAKIAALGLKDEHELQSWFIHQMDAFLSAHGRRLIGWDEILEGGLAPGAAVMSWRGEDGGIAAARAGHDVVMAPSGWTYLDHYQSKDKEHEPHAIGGYLPLERVYSYEPIPSALTAQEATHVLGSQGQLWTEYIGSPKAVEYMAFPRLSALSEVVWSPKEARNFLDFKTRLSSDLDRLKVLDVNFRQPKDSD
jgi:hexosaminidase